MPCLRPQPQQSELQNLQEPPALGEELSLPSYDAMTTQWHHHLRAVHVFGGRTSMSAKIYEIPFTILDHAF